LKKALLLGDFITHAKLGTALMPDFRGREEERTPEEEADEEGHGARGAKLARSQRQRLSLDWMIRRVIRVAETFEEAERFDRQDVAALSFEERISGVERLRKVWFGEDRLNASLERVLVAADQSSEVPLDRRPRRRRSR